MGQRTTVPPSVLILHVGWARAYHGDDGDVPVGKFGYLRQGHDDPGEALNFKNFQGRCFGYSSHHKLDLQALGAAPESKHADGILVIWTATNPDGSGRYVVGWYRNARVYPTLTELRPSPNRRGILAEAKARDCHLVPVDERTFYIPSQTKGWPIRGFAFYANQGLSNADLKMVLAYVDGQASVGLLPDGETRSRKVGRSQDPAMRALVEKAAVDVVTQHYEALGWNVESVEADKVGWDLDVTCGRRKLLVEVKGRGATGPVELTPGEYRAMHAKAQRMAYRLAVVHHALSRSPRLTIFHYAPVLERWVTEDGGQHLALEPKTGAVASF